jgi:superfamily I DNA and/or RNA helicase/very-short-patch-repair endonuclease
MPPSVTPIPGSNDQIISPDFFQGDIAAGLDRMRRRLLDLTNRNRLLNYKETKSSTLKVVDEIPDVLYRRLIDGDEMTFRPVPRPKRSEYPDQLELRNVDVRAYAERLGINTSYELPQRPENGDAPRNHTDKEIQTLHFPERLEAILGKINSSARLAIEETGTNMLYLVFGFLEWYDTDDSTTPHLAPLVLLPVSLRRGDPDPLTRMFRYHLSYSGEDILANISLEEKMRQDFKIELPEFGEEDNPESYFAKFSSILKVKEAWSIHRNVTLTLLSFGKLLMYRDLDPANWPKGTAISEHPRIREFFEGIQFEGITLASDYDLDEPDFSSKVPQLIDNADSSQHSVIIDALAGKNLVVQGPPGTGKSQTITNLIAAALCAGKTVLFVSEKLAALEVVRRRLDKAGLGTFCLELHSNKTKKDGLLKDISSRIDLYNSFQDASQLEAKLALLEEQKVRLREYAMLIGQNFGATGLSIHEIFWRRERLLSETKYEEAVREGLKVQSASSLTQTNIEKGVHLAKDFGIHLENVLNAEVDGRKVEKLALHPWYGISNESLSIAEQADLTKELRELASLTEALRSRLKEFSASLPETSLEDTGNGFGSTTRSIGDFVNEVTVLRDLDLEGVDAEALPRLRQDAAFNGLENLIRKIQEYRTFEQAVRTTFLHLPVFSNAEVDTARLAARNALRWVDDSLTIAEALNFAARMIDHAGYLGDAISLFSEINEFLSLGYPETEDGLKALIQTLEIIDTAPIDHLNNRHPGLEADGAVGTITKAARDAEPIKRTERELKSKLNLVSAPDKNVVIEHVAACANAGWLRFFDKKYKAARRDYLAMVRSPGRYSKDQIWKDYQELLDFKTDVETFCSNSRYATVLGPHFAGIDTAFDEQIRIGAWLAQIRESMVSHKVCGPSGIQAIWQLAAEKIRAYKGDRQAAARAALVNGVNSITIVLGSLTLSCRNEIDDSSLSSLQRSLLTGLNQLEQSCNKLLSLNFPDAMPLRGLEPALDRYLAMQRLKEEINQDEIAKESLPTTFRGVDTDTNRIVKTLLVYSRIDSSELPNQIKIWLESPETGKRIDDLLQFSGRLRESLGSIASMRKNVIELGSLDENDWYSNSLPFEDIELEKIASRANAAVEAKDLLPEWVLYRRARNEILSKGKAASVVDLVESGRIAPDQTAIAFELAVFQSLLSEVFSRHPVIEQFSGLSHNRVRAKFADLDKETLTHFRKRAAFRINNRRVPSGIGRGPVRGYTEASLLLHEIGKQRRHIPIRQLIHRAGRALQALKPCFMMGPLSVAQYLAPGDFQFDYVVMDEASQLKPEDALGAVARGKQVVIVGDRKQLPPTSFFDRIGEEMDEESEDNLAQTLEDSESILDVAGAVYQPSRMLRWHYRSRHASLIAFSNREFYEGNLIVFPSPIAKGNGLGVQLKQIADGIYGNRRNEKEALEVIEAVLTHMLNDPDLSLGVVAMNSAQRDLIEDLFLQKLKGEGESVATSFLESMKDRSEPFFIKNLENVQGDERDVIFVSMTYGPNEDGKVFQRFGPINSEAGHRRLNVLFTRARCRVTVFSSMSADQILVGPGSSNGVRALKGYLDYARTGILESAHFSGREPDSDFEIEVAAALKERGFRTVAQVGVAGFFIDLAVSHPEKEDTFILGIECDGASYHSSRSARDRDRLREEILQDLGWKLHRVWSVDWFRNRPKELERIVKAIRHRVREVE